MSWPTKASMRPCPADVMRLASQWREIELLQSYMHFSLHGVASGTCHWQTPL